LDNKQFQHQEGHKAGYTMDEYLRIMEPVFRQQQAVVDKCIAEGAEIIVDNVQDTIFGGFAPNSQTAEVLSKALGSRTVMSGSVSKGGGKDSASRSLQMMERPLMTPDELKSIPKGQFVVMKTGTHPMQTRLRLFLDWGISFGDPYLLPERAARTVAYASKQELEQAIFRCHHAQQVESTPPPPLPHRRKRPRPEAGRLTPRPDAPDGSRPRPPACVLIWRDSDHGIF